MLKTIIDVIEVDSDSNVEVRLKLLNYLETKEVYQLANVDEMSPEMQQSLKEGEELQERLLQYKFSPRTPDEIKSHFMEVIGNQL